LLVLLFYPEDGGSTFLRNVGKFVTGVSVFYYKIYYFSELR
jgi:hypothetical protein